MTGKKIETLVEDIYTVMAEGVEVSEDDANSFGASMATLIRDRLAPKVHGQPSYLRPSNIGERCDRKTWYSVHRPEAAEEMSPDTYVKFLIGDVMEEIFLMLAKFAGHTVTGQQDTMTINGVSGSRDAVIDGVTVDVKSASPYSFDKFKTGLKEEHDSFGYLPQINFYREAAQDDETVTDKDRAAFLVGHKVLGKVALDIHEGDNYDYSALIDYKQGMLADTKVPARGYEPEPDGKSGNMKLGVNCSYCQFKQTCYPNLRTFLYSSGPRYLTEVAKEPNVTEVFE